MERTLLTFNKHSRALRHRMSDFLSTLQPFEYQKKWYLTQIEEGNKELLRPDGRKMMEGRVISCSTGTISTSHGSSSLTLGAINGTICHTGIKIEFTPLSSSSNGSVAGPKINFIYNLTLAAGSSPSTRPGPPGECAQSISKLIGNELLPMLIEINIIKPTDTLATLVPDGLDVILYIDTIVTSHNGNIFSSAWSSVFSALMDCKLPSPISLTEESFLLVSDSGNSGINPKVFNSEANKILLPFKLMNFEILNRNIFLNDCSLEEEDSLSGNNSEYILLLLNRRGEVVFARGSLPLTALPSSLLKDIIQ